MIRNWFTKNLGDAMMAGTSLDSIRELFQVAHEKAGYSHEMAVFIRHESAGQLHCEVKVYFSPATRIVAETVAALPCEQPSTVDLGLLAGSEESWLICFPSGKATGK